MSRSAAQATAVTGTWVLMLIALSLVWIRSPFLGPGAAFALWSIPAAVVVAATYGWLRRQDIPEIPRSPWLIALIGVAWVMTLVIAYDETGARLTLDGIIMRRGDLHLAGRLLYWLPLGFGGIVSIAGLAVGLEARYRLVNDPGTPATPKDPTR